MVRRTRILRLVRAEAKVAATLMGEETMAEEADVVEEAVEIQAVVVSQEVVVPDTGVVVLAELGKIPGVVVEAAIPLQTRPPVEPLI
jgi:hypothetical protein